MRKAYVGDVRRVPKIPLVFGLLEKRTEAQELVQEH